MTEALSHLTESGQAHMVDTGAKQATHRSATAEGCLSVSPKVWQALTSGKIPKGDLWATARIAGIMAAKRTAELIPLCHPLCILSISVDFALDADSHRIVVKAECAANDRTGVEMEALVATSVALLTLYDMTKGLDKASVIGPVRLVAKSGGKSGDYRLPEESWFDTAKAKMETERQES